MKNLPLPWPLFIGPVAIFIGMFCWQHSFDLISFFGGIFGYCLALALRPAAQLATKALAVGPTTTARIMTNISGPAEEAVRWICIWVVVADLPAAIWLGIGWSLSEVCFFAVTIIILRRIIKRGGKHAAALEENLKASPQTPFVRLFASFERFSVSLAHIGFSLWLFAGTIWLLPAIIVHSVFNQISVALLVRKKSLLTTEAMIFVSSVIILCIGILLN